MPSAHPDFYEERSFSMSYKLLALDLDNTLLYKDLTMAVAARAGLRRLLDQGILVTLATGRMFPSAAFYARQVGITCPLATYNGALIRSTQPGGYELLRPLSLQTMKDIAAFCRKHGYYAQLYNEDRILVEKRTKETDIDPDLIHNPVVEVGDFSSYPLSPSPKMILVVSPEEREIIHRQLREEFGDSLTLAASKDYLVEIMAKDVSKASALELICRRYGVAPDEVVCCGDNSNDAAMIKWAGLGVAVENASPAVKEIADYVATKSYGDGVAEVIAKFF